MDAPDKPTSLAARIADGSDIDWAAAQSATGSPDDRALVDELRAIADIATAHRAPSAWPGQRQPPTRTWGPLTILEPLSTGRFGDVYLAWDARLQRRVALKLLRVASTSLASPTRAIDEARLLARVRHLNVLTVYGAEYVDDQVGIWTEFIEGRTLAAELAERGTLPPNEVIEIGVDLCRALSAVHDAGLLHRDIKAQNVMRETGGRIVLMDFGAGHDLALSPVRDGDLTGTPLYLAPEVLAGVAASPASDVYALGVLLFHSLTGTHPVTGRTLEDVRAAHGRGVSASLGELRPDVVRVLVDAVERGIARAPEQRFRSARDFEKTLLSSRPVVAVPGAPEQGSAGGTERWHRGLMAALLGLAVVAGAVSWVVLGGRPHPVTPTLSPTNPPPQTEPPGPNPLPEVPPEQKTESPVVRDVTPAPVTSALPARGRSGVPSLTLVPGFPGLIGIGSVSADGRFVSQFDAARALVIRDLETLAGTRIGAASDGQAGTVTWSRFSRDSKRVAYQWYPADGRARLGVVDVSGEAGVKPQWYVDDPQTAVSQVHDWSGDGRVLVSLDVAGGKSQMAWISTTDGSISTVLEHERKFQIRPYARVSPDGRYIAYAARELTGESVDSLPMHLYLRAADGSSQEAIVMTGAQNANPIWSPDGTRLFYTSDVSSTVDLWSIPVRDGRPNGNPRLVKSNVGDGRAIDITANGFYYHLRFLEGLDQVFVVDFPDNPNRQAEVPFADPFVGRRPRWSPDGRSLVLLRRRPAGESQVVVVTPPDRAETVIGSSASGQPLLWLDPRTVLAQSEGARDRPEPRVIDVLTHQVTAGGALPPGLPRSAAAAVSPDGRTLYAAAGDLVTEAGRRVETPWNRLVSVDLATGDTRLVWQFPDDLVATPWNWLTGIALSPDGRDLAVAVCPTGARKTRLFRIGVDGTGYRDLYQPYEVRGAHGKVAWSARGIYIGEVVTPTGPEASWRVMLVHPDTGGAQVLLRINGSDAEAEFDPHPDGSRIALNPGSAPGPPFSGRGGGRHELWQFDLRAVLSSASQK